MSGPDNQDNLITDFKQFLKDSHIVKFSPSTLISLGASLPSAQANKALGEYYLNQNYGYTGINESSYLLTELMTDFIKNPNCLSPAFKDAADDPDWDKFDEYINLLAPHLSIKVMNRNDNILKTRVFLYYDNEMLNFIDPPISTPRIGSIKDVGKIRDVIKETIIRLMNICFIPCTERPDAAY